MGYTRTISLHSEALTVYVIPFLGLTSKMNQEDQMVLSDN
jgi:hypothetical protein